MKHALLINAGYTVRPHDAIHPLARSLTGNVRIEYLKNGDIQTACDFDLSEYEVYILGDLQDQPWAQLALFSVLCEALQRRHAVRITLVVPIWSLTGMRSANYAGTARSDSSRTITRLLADCGIDRIVTLTPSALLRSPLFPIEVVRPNYGEVFKRMLPGDFTGRALLMAEDPMMYVSARELSYEAETDIAVNHYADHRTMIAGDVQDRHVIIYTEELNGRKIVDLEHEVLKGGAKSCSIFAPVINMEMPLLERLIGELSGSVYSFDHSLYGMSTYLSADRIIADWIAKDIQERGLMAEEL